MLAFLYGSTAQAQITRGVQPAEIYISTDWYIDNYGDIHYAIFHSTDNGEHIILKYENIETPPPGEMQVGRVLGDATPGALYNWGWNELWVSFDYGESWEYKEDYSYAKYATGFYNGEIYRRSNYNLYRSENYGETFELIVISLSEPLSDVGNQEGELFGFTGSAGIGYNLYHSTDYGLNFLTVPIDSSVAFYSVSGHYPQISRGTEPGELYLVSWWPDDHYKIFHSIDTGYTWTEKYESDYINQYFWEVQYTAGRQPGSFYVMRSTVAPAGDHIWLYIDYSSDYGETFTTYFHDLDSLFTSITSIKKPDYRLSAFPNPFSEETTIKFELPENYKNPVLNICDIHGKIIRQYNITEKKSQQWDGRDGNGNRVPNGVYFYNIKFGNFTSQFKKVLFIDQTQ
jgi:hypothetical protein